MQPLFAISLVSFLVLFLAGVAAIRRTRSRRARSTKATQDTRDFAEHLRRATEDGTLASVRSIPNQSVKQVFAIKSWNRPPDLMDMPSEPNLQQVHRRNESSATPKKDATAARKPPQTLQKANAEHQDLASFSKDLGDPPDLCHTPRERMNLRHRSHHSNV
jgi:hypothetical protein